MLGGGDRGDAGVMRGTRRHTTRCTCTQEWCASGGPACVVVGLVHDSHQGLDTHTSKTQKGTLLTSVQPYSKAPGTGLPCCKGPPPLLLSTPFILKPSPTPP